MNNEMTQEEYLALAASEWKNLEELEKEEELYDYEKKLENIFLELGRKYLESRVNNKSKDRRKKKIILTRLGSIKISKTHSWLSSLNGFRISPYLQELALYASQEDNYEQSSKDLSKYLRLEIGSSQLARLSEYYGQQLGEVGQNQELVEEKVDQLLEDLSPNSFAYVMMDGSMIPTREGENSSDWKEVKLGRFFTSSSLLELDKSHNYIRDSLYVGHLGKSTDFLEKLEIATDALEHLGKRLVFINDGARWIWNWVDSHYPNAISILDFYHVVENIAGFINSFYKDKESQEEFLNTCKELLLKDEVDQVITSIQEMETRSKTLKQKKKRLLGYLERNKKRMLYQSFKQQGLMIGSGPIESAHRTVLQKRLKQPGQRWGKKGAQNIINLRIANQNGQWDKVIQLFKTNNNPSLKIA